MFSLLLKWLCRPKENELPTLKTQRSPPTRYWAGANYESDDDVLIPPTGKTLLLLCNVSRYPGFPTYKNSLS